MTVVINEEVTLVGKHSRTGGIHRPQPLLQELDVQQRRIFCTAFSIKNTYCLAFPAYCYVDGAEGCIGGFIRGAGNMPDQLARKSMKLFAEKVAPAPVICWAWAAALTLRRSQTSVGLETRFSGSAGSTTGERTGSSSRAGGGARTGSGRRAARIAAGGREDAGRGTARGAAQGTANPGRRSQSAHRPHQAHGNQYAAKSA